MVIVVKERLMFIKECYYYTSITGCYEPINIECHIFTTWSKIKLTGLYIQKAPRSHLVTDVHENARSRIISSTSARREICRR